MIGSALSRSAEALPFNRTAKGGEPLSGDAVNVAVGSPLTSTKTVAVSVCPNPSTIE